jgi:hypothetical protein
VAKRSGRIETLEFDEPAPGRLAMTPLGRAAE